MIWTILPLTLKVLSDFSVFLTLSRVLFCLSDLQNFFVGIKLTFCILFRSNGAYWFILLKGQNFISPYFLRLFLTFSVGFLVMWPNFRLVGGSNNKSFSCTERGRAGYVDTCLHCENNTTGIHRISFLLCQ
jgi:hypothetical protein